MFRIGITIGNEQRYITMYSFGYNIFISFLEDNPKNREQFDKYTTQDYNQEAKAFNNPEIKSYLDKLKTKLEQNKTRTYHLLFMQTNLLDILLHLKFKKMTIFLVGLNIIMKVDM